MQQLIVATRNRSKTREIQQILGPKFELRDLTAYPVISEIVENGNSFEENAKLKAIAVSKELSGLIIADDSGLEVAALGGTPGTYSARYAGNKATDKENVDRLLEKLARIGQMLGTFKGIVEGTIVDQPRGSRGFGYDPIFVPNGFEETFGELPAELKNRISHRAQAIHALAAKLAALKPSYQGFGGGGGGGGAPAGG